MIHLACTRGVLGHWEYYSTVMKIKDIVDDKRIITVAESDELYTKNINRILQRELKEKRINNISKYIIENEERFVNSLVVAIHNGRPKWTEIDLNQKFSIDGTLIDNESVSFLNKKFGVLTLYGDEEIFALDGQHRLKGLRRAFKQDSTIGDLEIPLTFVLHNHKALDKTRRLFTVLNKYAEKPRGAELIILDEDDASAINTRKLATEHSILKLDNSISKSKTGSIPKSDIKSFTTLVTIDKINKIIYKKSKAFYNNRPSESELEKLYKVSEKFWDNLFEAFPELVNYIEDEDQDLIKSRNHVSGGSLLIRPIGQEMLAHSFINHKGSDKQFRQKIRKINFNLSHKNWKYVFWNERILGKEIKVKKAIFYYLIGIDTEVDVEKEMARIYKSHNKKYIKGTIKPI